MGEFLVDSAFNEPLGAIKLHFCLQILDHLKSVRNLRRAIAPAGKNGEGFEQECRFPADFVQIDLAAQHGILENANAVRIARERHFDVVHAIRDMPRLVFAREVEELFGRQIGRAILEKLEQINKRSLAHDVQQEACGEIIVFFEQAKEALLRGERGILHAQACRDCALREGFDIHGEELRNTRDPEKTPSLADCIFAFEELKSLKFKQREKYRRMFGYLDTMRNMRNDESHVTPNASEEEIFASSRIVTTLYLYITANSITELEMSGKI